MGGHPAMTPTIPSIQELPITVRRIAWRCDVRRRCAVWPSSNGSCVRSSVMADSTTGHTTASPPTRTTKARARRPNGRHSGCLPIRPLTDLTRPASPPNFRRPAHDGPLSLTAFLIWARVKMCRFFALACKKATGSKSLVSYSSTPSSTFLNTS
jgi:hypothetical protein